MTKARDLGDTVNNNTIPGSRLVDGAVTQAKRSEDFTRATLVTPAPFSSASWISLPSWIKRITVSYWGISLNGTDHILIQLGSGGTYLTSSYYSVSNYTTSGGATSGVSSGSGFVLFAGDTNNILTGRYTFDNITANAWVGSGLHVYDNNNIFVGTDVGKVSLPGTLDSIRVIGSGSNTFDAGQINIFYE